jgi:uncharacterized membrane protein
MTTTTEALSKPDLPTNMYGRRGGRGVRPWLLVPKVVAIALYVGGLAAVTFIWVGSRYNAMAPDDARRQWVLNLVGRMMVFFVVPALLIAMVLGVLLLLQHPRVYLRMRWLRVKLLLLLIVIPFGHFWCRTQTLKLRDAGTSIEARNVAASRLSMGLIGTLIGSIGVVVIGRSRPRLGQNWARDYPMPPET